MSADTVKKPLMMPPMKITVKRSELNKDGDSAETVYGGGEVPFPRDALFTRNIPLRKPFVSDKAARKLEIQVADKPKLNCSIVARSIQNPAWKPVTVTVMRGEKKIGSVQAIELRGHDPECDVIKHQTDELVDVKLVQNGHPVSIRVTRAVSDVFYSYLATATPEDLSVEPSFIIEEGWDGV